MAWTASCPERWVPGTRRKPRLEFSFYTKIDHAILNPHISSCSKLIWLPILARHRVPLTASLIQINTDFNWNLNYILLWWYDLDSPDEVPISIHKLHVTRFFSMLLFQLSVIMKLPLQQIPFWRSNQLHDGFCSQWILKLTFSQNCAFSFQENILAKLISTSWVV